MTYGPNLKKSNHTKRNILIAAISLVLVAVFAFSGWKYWQYRKLVKSQQSPNPQTELGNDSSTNADSSNTSEQNQKLSEASPSPSASQGTQSSQSSSSLPTPLLTKSSGNNGSIPSSVTVEFTCASTGSYSCLIRLTGAKTINLDTKSLTNNGRGDYGALWDWTSQKGTWTVVAVLTDGKGAEKTSAPQTLEVK